MKYFCLCLLSLITIAGLGNRTSTTISHAQSLPSRQHLVQPGDTWAALALRYGLTEADLAATNRHINRQRQPTIGTTLSLPDVGEERMGTLVRSGDGGLLSMAMGSRVSVWLMAMRSNVPHPYTPLFYRPLFIPGGTEPPRDLPVGLDALELSQIPAHPGEAIAFRALASRPISLTAQLSRTPMDVFGNGRHLVGLGATGAFYGSAEPELAIQPAGGPLWSQPWAFVDKAWILQQLTLTGDAAAIDAESIRLERERLFALWAQRTAAPQWAAPFQLPINNYLEISSPYGARRSYNGGPYLTYHEGWDFSAYRGTPVLAPAAGTVALAETLFVRGGAVIIDHGLGIYSGVYHLSAVHALPGQQVVPGQMVGEVGTTGLSTGNHLHWDLLVNNTWVDPAAWLEQDMACWILVGLGRPCGEQ